MTKAGEVAAEKMRQAGLDDLAIRVFQKNLETVQQGSFDFIRETDISPLTDIPTFDAEGGAGDAIERTAVIKLNGGLGTSMGLQNAKSLLNVTADQTFLDITVHQVLSVREQTGATLPLIFMNSFRTEEDTSSFLAKYADLPVEGIPLSFIQNRVPKIRQDDYMPVEWPADPSLEWCPPGHGDLFTALPASGLLRTLLDRGFRYAMVANGDNLGAYPDPVLAQWFADSGVPFAMEVCRRAASDRKGGHLAVRNSDGTIILREIAQTDPADLDSFQDLQRHSYFNTNTLWLDLEAVAAELARGNGYLGLPVIRNVKNVDPTDKTSTPVFQLETGMGSAIEVFPGSTAIAVGRDRFMPVKTTNDLLLLRSDLFEFTGDGKILQTVPRLPHIRLDPEFFGTINEFEKRCESIPSLKNVTSLAVEGDFVFEPETVLEGDVTLHG